MLVYAIAQPIQSWANTKLGESFYDPNFLYGDMKILAMMWLLAGCTKFTFPAYCDYDAAMIANLEVTIGTTLSVK